MITNSQILEKIYTYPEAPIPQSPLAEIQSRKKPWVPFAIKEVKPNPLSLANGSYETIQRCIALALALELPVGNWALNGTKLEGDLSINQALINNAHDEETHFNAFLEARKAYSVPQHMVSQVEGFRDQLMTLEEHPVLLAGFTELSVFFVTLAILRKYGSADLKKMIHYVSRDESTHVNTNYWIVDKGGITFNDFEKVDRLRSEIIDWLVEPLNNPEDRRFWHNQSLNLMMTRKAPDLEWTSTGNFTAFFEMPKTY